MTRHFDKFCVQFVCKEGNIVTDWLAKTCVITDADIWLIDIPDEHARKLLLNDSMSIPIIHPT